MALALRAALSASCRELGLRLDVCPGGEIDEGYGVCVYDSAEQLFDYLCSSARPLALADTLVVLDVADRLEAAISPAIAGPDSGWYATKQRRAGVAVEMVLRFPQVFPVFLSPAVPIDWNKEYSQSELINPAMPNVDGWATFHAVIESLTTGNRWKEDNIARTERIASGALIHALRVPLHFVSPLDGGCGLRSTLERFARGMRCWFDPTGLRTLVKNAFLGSLFGSNNNWENTASPRKVLLERLDAKAVAIDEEREFATLNGYAAYRFGRRAWIVTTFSEFDDNPLWVAHGTRDKSISSDDTTTVVLRDIDLRFPDLPDVLAGNEIAARSDGGTGEGTPSSVREQLKCISSAIWKTCDGVERIGKNWRVRAVSSHPNTMEKIDPEWADTERRLGEFGGSYYGLSKPVGSLYQLTTLLDVDGEYRTGNKSIISRLESVRGEGIGDHGAPYLNLAFAESLLDQSRQCKEGPTENLLGALLAGEAYELLLGMSKTTALEALLAMHKKEAAAEVEFPGISHDIHIARRRKDIDDTLRALYKASSVQDDLRNNEHGSAESGKTNKAVQAIYRSQFWSELRQVYKTGEQFTAAEEANAESLIHSKWLPLPLQIRLPSSEILKRALLFPATSILGWCCTALLFSLFMAACYAAAVGYSVTLTMQGFLNFGRLWHQVVLGSLQVAPSKGILNLEDLLAAQSMSFSFYMVSLIHFVVSYILFGLLVTMLYRKITRG